YSGTSLDVYYNGGQQVVVDYREDIGRIIEENDLSFDTGEDVRHVLYEYTPVVPIYSPKITVDDKNRPIFMTSRHKSGQLRNFLDENGEIRCTAKIIILKSK